MKLVLISAFVALISVFTCAIVMVPTINRAIDSTVSDISTDQNFILRSAIHVSIEDKIRYMQNLSQLIESDADLSGSVRSSAIEPRLFTLR